MDNGRTLFKFVMYFTSQVFESFFGILLIVGSIHFDPVDGPSIASEDPKDLPKDPWLVNSTGLADAEFRFRAHSQSGIIDALEKEEGESSSQQVR